MTAVRTEIRTNSSHYEKSVAKALKRLKANRVHKFQRMLSLNKRIDADGASPAATMRSTSLTKQLSGRAKEFFSPPAQSAASTTSSSSDRTARTFSFSRSFRAASKKFFSPPRDAAEEQQRPTDQANYFDVAAGSAEALAEAAWAQEDRAQRLAVAPLSTTAGNRSQSLSAALNPALKSPPADADVAEGGSSLAPLAPAASAMAGRRSVSFGGLLRRASFGRLFSPAAVPIAVHDAVPEETATTEADDAQGHHAQLAFDDDAENLTIDDATSASSAVRAQ